VKGALIISALLLFVVLYQNEQSSVRQPPGILAPGEPFQIAVESQPRLVKKGYRIEALARFSIQARVLRAEHYRFDRAAELVPVDLVLGWGEMSNSEVVEKISISQGQRVYEWSAGRNPPIPPRAIALQSANMHMVPANGDVARVLKEARPGNVVKIYGYLIDARASDGFHMRSSLTREDTGMGACEVIWVERIDLI
jgi:hypothetical protein